MADDAAIIEAGTLKTQAFYAPWIEGPMPSTPPPSARDAYAALWPLDDGSNLLGEGDIDDATRTALHVMCIDYASLAAGNFGQSHPEVPATVDPNEPDFGAPPATQPGGTQPGGTGPTTGPTHPPSGQKVPVVVDGKASAFPWWGYALGGAAVAGLVGTVIYFARKEG